RSLRHRWIDLVSGRVELRASSAVPHAIPRHDSELARFMEDAGDAFLFRANRTVQIWCEGWRALSGTLRIADANAENAEHRNGRDQRHRKREGHSSKKQEGRRAASGVVGSGENLWQ